MKLSSIHDSIDRNSVSFHSGEFKCSSNRSEESRQRISLVVNNRTNLTSNFEAMKNLQLTIAAIIGFLGVALGAMGAHALKDELGPVGVNSYLTGVRYLFYHVFAIMLMHALSGKISDKLAKLAGWFFIIGIVLFSGSIFLLSTIPVHGMEAMRTLGPVTPIGGLLFMVGWVIAAVGFVKGN
ncbi:MAG: uncharacterized membrane protein YgdD (TMEM256/DUF423 family) [Granulosicoccus sp.]|jgi:uncharacterized membrane protein YgdD (TMEM256/DUF423 family)